MTPVTEKLAYSPKDAATATSLSLRQIMKDIATGALRSFKKGKRRVILRADLEQYLRNEKYFADPLDT